jgi:ATP-binding cassette subfamily B protein
MYRIDFLVTLLVGIVIAISYSIIILYGMEAVFAGTLTTGLLIVFILYLDNLTIPILSIIDAAARAKESYLKISRMEEFFSKKTHLDYHTGEIKKVGETTIQFDRVSVKAGRHAKYILRDLSFTIEEGKRTVIVGANGSGKTSVVNLIMRFIEKPTSGTLYLGGVDIQKYDIKRLRGEIAFVPQEITLFNDTIHKNIAFGHPEATQKEVIAAARFVDAEGFIRNLPGGYDFKVGELGEFLSGGQRQRLMLARALMKKNAKIFLFDETLSALDVHARKKILENLYDISEKKTMILISNIFDVVSAADHVIVLNKGHLVYAGPHSRLPKEASLYKMIVDNE